MTYALDANIIIDFLNKEGVAVVEFDKTARAKIPMVIPSIVDYEVLRGFYHTPKPRKEPVYSNMRISCPVIAVNANISDCAAQIWAKLRKAGRTIGDADILIAATCIVNSYILVTHNVKHFEGIDELKFVDWIK